MKLKNKKLVGLLAVVLYCVLLICSMCLFTKQTVYASAQAGEALYCDDLSYDETGAHTSDTYDVYYDSVTVTNKTVGSAPSYGNGNTTFTNACAPLAGTNVVGYYDRWYTNLIPNYEPGLILSNGKYKYYPEYGSPEVSAVLTNLYNIMKTNQDGPGTSNSNFKNGLKSYVNAAGHNYSTSSFYKNGTMVDLNKLTTAVNENKVGLIMCQQYNFVSQILFINDQNYSHVVKTNSSVGHIMMVYGYRIVEYFKNGSNFRTDYFLCVSSCYSSAKQGYMQLNDFSTIDEAFIVSIN